MIPNLETNIKPQNKSWEVVWTSDGQMLLWTRIYTDCDAKNWSLEDVIVLSSQRFGVLQVIVQTLNVINLFSEILFKGTKMSNENMLTQPEVE